MEKQIKDLERGTLIHHAKSGQKIVILGKHPRGPGICAVNPCSGYVFTFPPEFEVDVIGVHEGDLDESTFWSSGRDPYYGEMRKDERIYARRLYSGHVAVQPFGHIFKVDSIGDVINITYTNGVKANLVLFTRVLRIGTVRDEHLMELFEQAPVSL